MDNNKVIHNPESAKYILSLRYNPLQDKISKLDWKDFISFENDISEETIQQKIENSIKNSITNSNESLTMALSGGIDSTLVLSLLKKIIPHQKIEALSIQFADSIDESKNAKIIADDLDVSHKTIFLENFFRELPKAISIIKQPFWDIHWYYLVKNVNSDWIVSGDGGDELFGGYTFRYSKFLSLINQKSSSREKCLAYLQCHERDHVPDQDYVFGSKLSFKWTSIYKLIEPYFSNSLSPLEQVFLADYNGKLLYNFSPISNNINNFFHKKSLRPILDPDLIQIATHIPYSRKYDAQKNLGKLHLRKILKNLNKEKLISKEKLGFSVNPKSLWLEHGYSLCEQYLKDSRLASENFINKNWIHKHLQKNISDIRYINKFFGLLAFEIWYRLFISKEMKENTLL